MVRMEERAVEMRRAVLSKDYPLLVEVRRLSPENPVCGNTVSKVHWETHIIQKIVICFEGAQGSPIQNGFLLTFCSLEYIFPIP